MTYLAVGTYTENLPHVAGKGTGIAVCDFDGVTGRLTAVSTTPGISNPSYLAFNPHRQTLYAVQESGEPETSAIKAYSVDTATGTLRFLNEQPACGAAPCHIHVEDMGRFLFGANYVSGSSVVFPLAADGRITHLHTVSTLPDGFAGPNAPAAIRVSADGRFVYASNRGHDTLAVFAFDESIGELKLLAHIPVHGRTPRDFILDPTGNFLLVASQDSDNIIVFRLNPQTGLPTSVAYNCEIPTPVCLQFLV
jgi:6-phosphogluconolactonase